MSGRDGSMCERDERGNVSPDISPWSVAKAPRVRQIGPRQKLRATQAYLNSTSRSEERVRPERAKRALSALAVGQAVRYAG